jgi:ATP-dependent exoDNAse (exonuclease V) alpha subunit
VLIHVDTEKAGEKLVNRRLAYVAVSRGRFDAQVYTNDKTHLTEHLSRDVSNRSATEQGNAQQPAAKKIEPPATRRQAQTLPAHVQSIER